MKETENIFHEGNGLVPAARKSWDQEWEIPEAEQGLTYDDGFLFGPDTNETPAQKKST